MSFGISLSKHRVGRAVFASLVFAGATVVPASAAALDCSRDADCPGDLICDGGQCMRQDGSAPTPQELGGAAGAVGEPQAAPAAMVAAPAPVTVTLERATVTFYSEDPNGLDRVTHVESGKACNTPCALEVPPGVQNFEVVGTGGEVSFPIQLQAAQKASYEVNHFAPARFWVGMGMFVGGLAAFVPGLVLILAEDEVGGGAGLMIGGGVTFIVGEVLFLTAIGHMSQDARPPLTVGVAPLPEGGGVGALRLSF